MKRTIIGVVLLVLLLSLPAFAAISVKVSIPLPRLVITAPPALVVIPGTYVYFAPDVGADLVFYQGYWYRPYEGHWFRSMEYNGHWEPIHVNMVPAPLVSLPPNWRAAPAGYERMPYRHVKQNWNSWERDRHWDRAGRRSGGRGEAYGGRPGPARGEAYGGRPGPGRGEAYEGRPGPGRGEAYGGRPGPASGEAHGGRSGPAGGAAYEGKPGGRGEGERHGSGRDSGKNGKGKGKGKGGRDSDDDEDERRDDHGHRR